MWLNDRDLAKNEATFLKGPCPFQTIIENNVKIVVCRGHGLTLWGQGQTLSRYFNFHMINYTPQVGWEACFTSSVGCSTLISNSIKLRRETGGNEMYISNIRQMQTQSAPFIYHSSVSFLCFPPPSHQIDMIAFESDHHKADCSPEKDNRQTDCEIKMFTPISCQDFKYITRRVFVAMDTAGMRYKKIISSLSTINQEIKYILRL